MEEQNHRPEAMPDKRQSLRELYSNALSAAEVACMGGRRERLKLGKQERRHYELYVVGY